MIPNIAREYAVKKSMIFWGLGITEHSDGSYAVMAITHLALMTGNIGKTGAGLMPLRGQNNVQGACDMGMLPYFDPDYQVPKEIGLMTPQLVDEILEDRLKAIINIGEDLTHIHPNLNKVERAMKHLEFVMVQELFMTDVTKVADIVIGVKSAYEKTGVYVNAMRRLHLSQPLVECDMPDDWEVLQLLDQKMGGDSDYKSSKDVWDEVRKVAKILGVPQSLLVRHPFPGPGLAVRIIGEVTKKKLDITRVASKIVEEELQNADLYDKVWQAYAAVGDDKAVGVVGDERKYGNIVMIRIVDSIDAMTADWTRLPNELIEKISNRITNEIDEVTWVSYVVSSKPPATIEPQ